MSKVCFLTNLITWEVENVMFLRIKSMTRPFTAPKWLRQKYRGDENLEEIRTSSKLVLLRQHRSNTPWEECQRLVHCTWSISFTATATLKWKLMLLHASAVPDRCNLPGHKGCVLWVTKVRGDIVSPTLYNWRWMCKAFPCHEASVGVTLVVAY